MIADLEVAFARGHAGASLAFDRTPGSAPRSSRAITMLAALLTLPFVVTLIINGVGESTGWFSPPAVLPWLLGGGLTLAQGLALGPPLALLLLTIARVRVRASRTEDRRVLGVSARLDGWEMAVGLLALGVVGLFAGHLVADSFACANGVTRAC